MDMRDMLNVIAKANRLNLMGTDFINDVGAKAALAAYNGIGPEFFPKALRERVTRLLGLFEPPAVIHDCRFERSDGTRRSFDYANEEFVINCRKCAEAKYGVLNPKRYLYYAIIKAMNAYNCADFGGHRAWIDAYQKNKEDS